MKMFLSTLVVASLVSAHAVAEETNSLVKQLESLRPFIGKTWKGEFKNSTPENPKIDIQKWERALNGNAVRITHSINNGSYGGESIVMVNPKTSQVEFHYFTTAGFITHGTMEADGRKLITHEEVTGDANGTTQVKGSTELLPDGKMRVKTSYFKNGAWEDGRDMVYHESPGAEVRFK
jgi:hypothetical protein